jgi:hypothetical protein
MSDTPNLGLAFLEAAQAQKHVTVNEALRRLDALVQLAVLDRDLAAPPATPADGARYLVAAGASGAWSGASGKIAAFQDGAWSFLQPRSGWILFVLDEGKALVRTASAWIDLPGASQNLPMLGILTTADQANRLAVKSNGALFSHDDATPGTGDMRVTLNKSASAKDTGLVLQTGYSSRAMLGLLGDDALTAKVSPDGTTFKTALSIDKASGAASLPQSPKFSAYTSFDNYLAANSWTKVQFNTADHNGQGAFVAASNRFVAPFAGLFRLAAGLTFKANAALPTALHAALYRNGVAIARSTRAVTGLVSGKSSVEVDQVLSLAANDTVEVFAFMDGADGYVDQTRSSFSGHHLP